MDCKTGENEEDGFQDSWKGSTRFSVVDHREGIEIEILQDSMVSRYTCDTKPAMVRAHGVRVVLKSYFGLLLRVNIDLSDR
jgi:hypothetical protein